jgi:hydroxymethylpyrimidine/phosphomethylpyrimidine kinase
VSPRTAVLIIAGADSSGGAGLVRDVRALADLGIDALCAITAVTAQSNSRVAAVHHVPRDIICAQIAAAFETRPIGAVKIGMLGTRASVDAVAESLPSREAVPIVLDPVLVSSSGGILLDAEGREAMREQLFPRATLVTPNVPEAAALLGEDSATDESVLLGQARRLLALGPEAVLLKGGHAAGEEAVDWLVSANSSVLRIASPRLCATQRGTGCALASVIAAGLASGASIGEACQRAKRYVSELLQQAE